MQYVKRGSGYPDLYRIRELPDESLEQLLKLCATDPDLRRQYRIRRALREPRESLRVAAL
jgi:hypothetical protein